MQIRNVIQWEAIPLGYAKEVAGEYTGTNQQDQKRGGHTGWANLRSDTGTSG